MKKFSLALLLSLSAGAALAAGPSLSNVYLGGGFGLSHQNLDCSGASSCDDTDTGFKIYGGYQITPTWGVELAYTDFGKSKASGPFGPSVLSGEIEVSSWSLAATARVPVTAAVGLTGKLGFANVDTKVTGRLLGYGAGSNSESNTKAYLSLGADYAFTKNLRGVAFADFTTGEIEGEDGAVRLLGIGLQYNF